MVEGHSSIGILTFVVKVLFIDKVRSMITLGRRIKWLRGIHILALCCYSAIVVFVDLRVMVEGHLSQSSGGYIYGYSEHLHFMGVGFVVEG